MKLTFIDKNLEVVEALRGMFRENGFSFILGELSSVWDSDQHDILITPGNSYGIMDGGFDLAVAEMFPGIEKVVREGIDKEYCCELPVGAATWNLSPDGNVVIVYAPTMRTPCDIRGTLNVYLAMRAALACIIYNGYGGDYVSVVCPAMGTGFGGMHPLAAAKQMKRAWDSVNHPPVVRNLLDASCIEKDLRALAQEKYPAFANSV